MRAAVLVFSSFVSALVAGCGGGSPGGGSGGGPLPPGPGGSAAATILGLRGSGETSSLAASFEGSVPQGAKVTFVGDRVRLRGEDFAAGMRVFVGMNNDLARAEGSLLTTDAEDLPATPFVYTDPSDGTETILEVEAAFELVSDTEIVLIVPPAVSCSPDFSPAGGPALRVVVDGASSEPVTGLLFVVGPHGIAADPNRGSAAGGFPVVLHGDFFSPYTQVALRYVDPSSGTEVVLGDGDASNGTIGGADDVVEDFVDRHTIVVPAWPAAAAGLSADLDVGVLFLENVDDIASTEPGLGSACEALRPEGAVSLNDSGSRNFELARAFTYVPLTSSGLPRIDSVTPAGGSELGGDSVVVRGRNFDAITVGLTGPGAPGVLVECPAGSGRLLAPRSAVLVDVGTLLLELPPCPLDVATPADLRLRNRFTADTFGPADEGVRFERVLAYVPLPQPAPPDLAAVAGEATDSGCSRLVLLGDRFDGTTAASGVEVLHAGGVLPVQRAILHDEGILEVFLPRLPAPLATDVSVTLRLTNAAGAAEFEDAFVLRATPDAGVAPVVDSLEPAGGPVGGGGKVLVRGSGFDTDTTVRFGAVASPLVQFVSPGLLIAKVPPAAGAGAVPVVAVDDAVESAGRPYAYGSLAGGPRVATVEADAGGPEGGYAVVVRGVGFSAATRIEFGAGDGNFSPAVLFVDDTCLRVLVPAALPAQAGGAVALRAEDPVTGTGPAGAAFTYLGSEAPEILGVETTAGGDLRLHGWDRLLVSGSGFDASTGFDFTKGGETAAAMGVFRIAPGLFGLVAPPLPGDAGAVILAALGAGGESDGFSLGCVAVPAPQVLDVRSLSGGGASGGAGERIAIFGDFFFGPLTVRLKGPLADGSGDGTVALDGSALVLLGDAVIGLRLPEGVFATGPLGIEVETPSGTAAFEDGGSPLFVLSGPEAPRIDAVSPDVFLSSGGAMAVFQGRFLTPTTTLRVRTAPMPATAFQAVRGLRILSDTVATGILPPLLGGMPPAGAPGAVRAEETDPSRADAIDGDPFTVSGFEDPLFRVLDEAAPALLAVVPDRGTIAGGELVLLLGDGFLGADNAPNVDSIVFRHPDIGAVEYVRVPATEAPLTALPDGSNDGKFLVVNDSMIVLVTAPRPPILSGDALTVDVEVHGTAGGSLLLGAFTYVNTPAVRTPILTGLTPNETRLNGGTSHLLSGAFLTEADRIVLAKPGTAQRFEIPAEDFREVNDFFVVFEMPDLRGTFAAGDVLTVTVEKDVPGNPQRLISNALVEVLKVTFAGPPTIDVVDGLEPSSGSSFGGDVIVIRGSFFTTNSQVLFGTRLAPVIVFEDENTLRVIVPGLPIDAPGDGLDLLNLHEAGRDRIVDVAVFTQGGWAVLEDAFTLEPDPPVVTSISPRRAIEGSTTTITLRGERLLPNVTVVPLVDGAEGPLAGTVSNVTFVSLEEIRFDYTAASPDEDLLGPLEITFLVSTNHGSDTSPVFEVELSPFFTSVARSDDDADTTVPTTGIEAGARVVFEVEGGNFATGASFVVINRQGERLPLQEGTTLSGASRFVVDSPTRMRFTAPFAFGNDTPTLIEGNPNVGPADLEFRNANTLETSLQAAFTYVPSVLDFDSFGFRIPTGVPLDSVPHEVTLGDINGDGLTDAALMVRSASTALTSPEVYVFLADTFGDEDVNGDGIVPDFAGTFTKHVISNDGVRTEAGFLGRGGTVTLGDFDGDGLPELAVPVRVESNTNAIRVLLVDYDTSAGFVSKGVLATNGQEKSDAAGGIAVGNFDPSHAGDDIAVIVEDISKSKRRLTIFTSSGDFAFGQFTTDLPPATAGGRVGFLAAGNFDGEGPDELIWALSDWSTGSVREKDFPVIVATIDAGAKSLDLRALANFTGGQVHDIEIFDHDGDGADSAALIVQDEATFGGVVRPGGVAIVLRPLTLQASSYVETGFNANGRALGSGDIDGDGLVDLVAGNALGEFLVLIGRRDGTFADAPGSWFLPTIPESFDTRIESIGTADVNQDGLAEVWIGDIGSAPTSLQIFLNTSR